MFDVYEVVKVKLFVWCGLCVVVINCDDVVGCCLFEKLVGCVCMIVYGIGDVLVFDVDCELVVFDVCVIVMGIVFCLCLLWGDVDVEVGMFGMFNVSNLFVVFGLLFVVDVLFDVVFVEIEWFELVNGWM